MVVNYRPQHKLLSLVSYLHSLGDLCELSILSCIIREPFLGTLYEKLVLLFAIKLLLLPIIFLHN